MTPPTLAEPPAYVTPHHQKLTREQIDQVLAEDNGASALIVLLRNDRVDFEEVVDAINRQQSQPASKMKRLVVALVDAVFPGNVP